MIAIYQINMSYLYLYNNITNKKENYGVAKLYRPRP